MLKGKKIILGISGGIAAYKCASLIRLFKKSGADVKVVVTKNALEFITPTTIETLSGNKVYKSVFGEENDYSTEHISLTDWADLFVIAPATANIIGKFANGIADDALSTSFMAFSGPIFIAPAMNVKMYQHFAFQNNLKKLREQNIRIIEPFEGFLACGYEGKGRMAEPEKIIDFIHHEFSSANKLFTNKTVLITAGPTYESIDPVRFIGNHSSGKMGYALAETFARLGANVVLITGPVSLKSIHPSITTIPVVCASDMKEACLKYFKKSYITIMAAAVADYTPVLVHKNKIKKQSAEVKTIELKPTVDILAELGKLKTKKQILVGFALETENELNNAKEKLKKKNLDFIVLNSLKEKGAGFAYDTNKISVIHRNGEIEKFDLKSKIDVAVDIANIILKKFKNA